MISAIVLLVCSSVPGSELRPPRIAVSVATDVTPTAIPRMIEEADAVWKDAGVEFVWQRADEDHVPADVLVLVGGVQRSPPTRLPVLGWMETASRSPTYIHISFLNITDMLHGLGDPNSMPPALRDPYLGRALGRVLAHELGHYLLASRTHAPQGLMRAVLSFDMLVLAGLDVRCKPSNDASSF